MKVREVIVLAVSLAAITLVGPMRAQAGQATGCEDVNWPALQPSDPAYREGMDFAHALATSGFIVQCVAPSKKGGTFEEQAGAALYRTDRGSFDVLFLSRPQNFDRLEIVERQENGEYLYSFAGRPTPWPANLIAGPRPTFFVKHTNRLIVASDKEVAGPP